jgi:predicted membrane-bound spermidine synthase
MKMTFLERRRKAWSTTLYLGLVAVLLSWASYHNLTSLPLKLGRILFGLLLSALALWNIYLLVVMCAALAKMKKEPIQLPETTRGK